MAPSAATRKSPSPTVIDLVRVYDDRDPGSKATRVLVDRVWPRGVRKDELQPDRWMREIAPSDELRHWFGHRPERWPEFQKRYRQELAGKAQQELLDELAAVARKGRLMLLFGAKDEERNQAAVLRQVLLERIDSHGGSK